MDEKRIKYKYINLDKDKRIFVISDIHGGYNLFKKLLITHNFNENDYLFIVGDIIERGADSLATLRYVMELSKKGNVYAVIGNNDLMINCINNRMVPLYNHLKKGNKSIYVDMLKELNTSINDLTIDEFSNLKDIINSKYKDEIDFINSLPYVIETEDYLFAHAGLLDKNINNLTFESIISTTLFYNEKIKFDKLLFVGHFPVTAYMHEISQYNPIIDLNKNIVCLDGGYSIKDDGQLNLVIVDCNKNIETFYLDELQYVYVNEDTNYKNDQIKTLIWNQDELFDLEKGTDFTKCRSVDNVEFLIDNDFIYENKGKYYSFDITNYKLNLKKGEKVSLVYTYDDFCACKYKGVRGWIEKDKLSFPHEELRLAKYNEVKVVNNLSNIIKETFPLWNDEYPTLEIFMDSFKNNELYVFLLDGKIIGSICTEESYTKMANSIYLSRFFVVPEYRRKGYGRKIFSMMEKIQKEKGYKLIEFFVHNTHPFGATMYKEFGYRNMGRFEVPWDVDEGYYDLYIKRI